MVLNGSLQQSRWLGGINCTRFLRVVFSRSYASGNQSVVDRQNVFMTTVAIHQPNFVPSAGYFAKMLAADIFILLDSVHYTKNNWTNRNRIKGPNGVQWLTVPVLTHGRLGQKIRDVEINNQERWQHRHWQTVLSCYRRAAHFSRYAERIEQLYKTPVQLLAKWNETWLTWIYDDLDATARLVRSSELAGIEGEGTELIASLCTSVKATVYISGVGGKHYLDLNRMASIGVEVRYQENHPQPYTQLFGEFEGNLSILDLLLNEGPCAADLVRASVRLE